MALTLTDMTQFLTDRQTVEDLNLTGRFKRNSVINIFDRTKTRYGRQRLESMFRTPLSDASEINRRAETIGWFRSHPVNVPLTDDDVDSVEFYMGFHPSSGSLGAAMDIFSARARQMFLADQAWEKISEGIKTLSRILAGASELFDKLPAEGNPLMDRINAFHGAFPEALVSELEKVGSQDKLKYGHILSLDRKLRARRRRQVNDLMSLLYDMDVWQSVAAVAGDKNFCAAEAVVGKESFVDIKDVRHPALSRAVSNDLRIDSSSNVFFLTGVNMAGKSTLMKAVAVSVYLAHMGFPVPASSMRFTPLDGIYTSINVPDNIAKGYSHFYAEVLRVKGIAEKVRDGHRLFIIFDELFKGTNVKDAYDATLSVTQAFARHVNCLYIISTHIVEVGEELGKICDNVQFHCMPSGMEDGRLVYRYKLCDGISTDRHGMTIIRNEHILDIIKGENQE